MKKILNKKFLVGFLFIFVLGAILILPSILKAKVGGGTTTPNITVTVWADDPSLSYPNSGTTIHYSSSGATECDSGGLSYDFGTGALPIGTHTFTVGCSAPDPVVQCDSYTIDLNTCFTSDTKVLMADGTNKNIQDVKIGDVLKGESTDNKVLGLQRPQLSERRLYSFNGGRYFVTAEHPLKTIDGWKSIDPKKTDEENIGITVTELKVGDTLITEDGNVLLQTIDSKSDKADTQLYNFNLDGDHTYYADGYLVHNKAACDAFYGCGSYSVCAGGGSCEGGTVSGATPQDYEGYYCSGFSEGACGTWATHGCYWVPTGTCYPCPGSCPSGYTSSIGGSNTICTENAP
ncbi:MAG: Hint domain-containing protein, partial [Candidatus Nomurabacteria bacterium]|nr:Hint domain-containing protein [Candidatus Nomurabacteria bacterium]